MSESLIYLSAEQASTNHLIIPNLIFHAVGGQTCLELCKVYQYTDPNIGLYSHFAEEFRSQFVGAVAPAVALEAPAFMGTSRDHIP